MILQTKIYSSLVYHNSFFFFFDFYAFYFPLLNNFFYISYSYNMMIPSSFLMGRFEDFQPNEIIFVYISVYRFSTFLLVCFEVFSYFFFLFKRRLLRLSVSRNYKCVVLIFFTFVY